MISHRQEIRKNKSFDRTLYPIYYLLYLLGLNRTVRPDNSILHRIYSYTVFFLMILATGRRFRQVGERPDGSHESIVEFFASPNSLITLCNALIMLSGCLAGLLLYSIKEDEFEFLNILWDASTNSYTPEIMRKQYIFNTILVVASSIFNFMMAVFYASSRWGFFVYIVGKSHLSSETILCVLLDSYVLFISRCAISAVAMLFYQHCYVVRRSIRFMINKMTSPLFRLVPYRQRESSLRKIHECQVLYQQISNAKTAIENFYSGAIFYAYGICIPILCFSTFALINSGTMYWQQAVSVAIWVVNAVLLLFLFSCPAFRIHEEKQVTFLSVQMHSLPMILSAGNFFQMDRHILLSLSSNIFTYFLILYKFDIGNRTSMGVRNHLIQCS